MLAISRASDQPASAHHGRADRRPGAVVAQVEEVLVRLGEDGDMSVLVIEQNIGVATAISKTSRSWSMAASTGSSTRAPGGRPRAATTLAWCWRRRRPRRAGNGSRSRRCKRRRARPAAARAKYGAGPHLHLQSHAADALVAAGTHGAHRGRRAHFRPAWRIEDAARQSARPGWLYKAHRGHPSSLSPARSIPRARSCVSFAT